MIDFCHRQYVGSYNMHASINPQWHLCIKHFDINMFLWIIVKLVAWYLSFLVVGWWKETETVLVALQTKDMSY